MGPEEADQRSHRTGQHPAFTDGHEGEQGKRTGGRAHNGESPCTWTQIVELTQAQ